MDKEKWRSEFRAKRDSLTPEFCSEANRGVTENLKKLIADLKCLQKVHGAYRAYRSELNLDQYFFSDDESKWAFPRVSDKDLVFYRAHSQNDFTKGAFGLWEPDPSKCPPVNLSDFGIIVVPGVAFDRNGRRLGYGKGYYDRALQRFKGVKIGVAYKIQLTDEDLPNEDHDILMDYVVTEDFTLVPLYKKGNE